MELPMTSIQSRKKINLLNVDTSLLKKVLNVDVTRYTTRKKKQCKFLVRRKKKSKKHSYLISLLPLLQRKKNKNIF